MSKSLLRLGRAFAPQAQAESDLELGSRAAREQVELLGLYLLMRAFYAGELR